MDDINDEICIIFISNTRRKTMSDSTINRNRLKFLVMESKKTYGANRQHFVTNVEYLDSDLNAIFDAIDTAFAESKTCEWWYDPDCEVRRPACKENEWVDPESADLYEFCPYCSGKIVALLEGVENTEMGVKTNPDVNKNAEPEPKYNGQITCQKCGMGEPEKSPLEKQLADLEIKYDEHSKRIEAILDLYLYLKDMIYEIKKDVQVEQKSP